MATVEVEIYQVVAVEVHEASEQLQSFLYHDQATAFAEKCRQYVEENPHPSWGDEGWDSFQRRIRDWALGHPAGPVKASRRTEYEVTTQQLLIPVDTMVGCIVRDMPTIPIDQSEAWLNYGNQSQWLRLTIHASKLK